MKKMLCLGRRVWHILHFKPFIFQNGFPIHFFSENFKYYSLTINLGNGYFCKTNYLYARIRIIWRTGAQRSK
jgi:hypothetical protein